MKILFIDDDEIERLKFNRIAKQNTISVEVSDAINGEDALKKLEENIPHLIILDLNMPKMNGIEFLKILRAETKLKYIPIVILSSSDNREDIKQCYEVGVSGFMLKPLRYEDYKKNINTILNYWNVNELID